MIICAMNSGENSGLIVKSPNKSETSEFEKEGASNEPKCSPLINSDLNSTVTNNESSFLNSTENHAALPEDSNQLNGDKNVVLCEPSRNKDLTEVDCDNSGIVQDETPATGSLVKVEDQLLSESADSRTEQQVIGHSTSNGRSEVVVKTSKPLCADYRSDSDSEFDSESDSTASLESTSEEASSDGECESEGSHDSGTVKSNAVKGEKKLKGDLSFADLPPIENLTISVPEDACVEIGTITSIVDTLVIVESYRGTAALDVDSVLFLDCGKKTLGKVFDILGPVTEPVYAVRFNSKEEIDALNIKKDMKVYYAPKTEHTNFVFMSEVLKHKGSDASWKDNAEAPPEFQDFSDDEKERLFKNKQTREIDGENPNLKEQNKSRKRSFNKAKHHSGAPQPNRARNPNFLQQKPHFHRNPATNRFASAPPFARPNFPSPVQGPSFPYRVPSCSGGVGPLPPHFLFPPRISGPPFPAFGNLSFVDHGQNFQRPFYQQRTHAFPQAFGAWGRAGFRPPPPPPPPPPVDQTDRDSAK